MQKKVVAFKSACFLNKITVYYLKKNVSIIKIHRLNDEPFNIKQHVKIIINEMIITLIKTITPIHQNDSICITHQPQLNPKDFEVTTTPFKSKK